MAAPDGKTVLAVIPARGGSKRVPRKNLREYRGTPLIKLAWNGACQSAYIDAVFVSTEDDEIKALCMGMAINYRERPAELATDTATCEDVLRYHAEREPHDWLVLLQPTSPLRTAEDIDRTIEKAVSNGFGAISTYQYRTNGAVYVASADWLAEHEFSHAGLAKYEMPEERSLDINEPEDFDK